MQVLVLATTSGRVCKQEAIAEGLAEDEGLAGLHLLASVAALCCRAGAICDLQEVGRDARTIVRHVDCIVLLASTGESWAKEILVVAGIVHCWPWRNARGGRDSTCELSVDDCGRGLDRAGRGVGDRLGRHVGKDRGRDLRFILVDMRFTRFEERGRHTV